MTQMSKFEYVLSSADKL